jgi:hypothetical protein
VKSRELNNFERSILSDALHRYRKWSTDMAAGYPRSSIGKGMFELRADAAQRLLDRLVGQASK